MSVITVSNLAFDPPSADCGDAVEISAEISFSGKARKVSVTVEIQTPCTLDGGPSISTALNGPSPQTLRIVATVDCPQGGARRPLITVRARDNKGNAGSTSRRLPVQC